MTPQSPTEILRKKLAPKLQQARSGRIELLAKLVAEQSIGCVDEFTQDAHVNVPGSILLYYFEYRQELLTALKQIQSGTLTIHLHYFCAYLYLEKGMKTARSQRRAIGTFQTWLRQIAGGRFRIRYVIEDVGSAKALMTEPGGTIELT